MRGGMYSINWNKIVNIKQVGRSATREFLRGGGDTNCGLTYRVKFFCAVGKVLISCSVVPKTMISGAGGVRRGARGAK